MHTISASGEALAMDTLRDSGQELKMLQTIKLNGCGIGWIAVGFVGLIPVPTISDLQHIKKRLTGRGGALCSLVFQSNRELLFTSL